MICECPYLAEGFLHNFCPCYDIVQLGVTQRIRNKVVEMAAVAECFLIITHVKNKESKKQLFQIYLLLKLADGKILIKK